MHKGQGCRSAPKSWHSSFALFFVIINNRTVSYSGMKGYLNTIKNTLKTDLGWRAYIIMGWERVKKTMQKREPGYTLLRICPDGIICKIPLICWYSKGPILIYEILALLAMYECLTRCIHGHECDCHNWTVINTELMVLLHP